MNTNMVMLHVPDNKELLSALGEVTLRHEHMNHILKMTIKSLSNITPAEAIAATKYESSSQLRRRINKLARKRLGEGQALLKLQAILANCEKLTEKRNALVHGIWAQELDGDAHVRNAYGNMLPIPTVQELVDLAKEIESHTNNLNFERLEGFLKKELTKKDNGA